ncbi:MAG TPA: sigma factor [Phycisphaerae bacterium]|nr:sigma factor [Phycisphaerae bacterium]
MSHQVRLDRLEEWFIARTARQLAGKAGFTPSDVEDIEQDIRLDVLQRLPRFDPAQSSRHTFIVMLVRRCAASILERRRAEKRNRGRRSESLNVNIRDAEGREVERHQTIDSDTGRPGPSDEQRRDLMADVRAVVASLPEHLRFWCVVFDQRGIREASRELGIPRCRLQRIKAEIRVAFEAAGLSDCLR